MAFLQDQPNINLIRFNTEFTCRDKSGAAPTRARSWMQAYAEWAWRNQQDSTQFTMTIIGFMTITHNMCQIWSVLCIDVTRYSKNTRGRGLSFRLSARLIVQVKTGPKIKSLPRPRPNVVFIGPWWCHQMETFSSLLAFYEVTGDFPS